MHHSQYTIAITIPTMSPSLVLLFIFISTSTLATTPPTPTPWPPQFHSIIFNNNTNGKQQLLDLWYDYPNGRNLNIIQNQLGKHIYEVEWNNGTSFTYTLDSSQECDIFHYEVGILIPNWLHGANYLGQRYMDGFLCNVWEKVQFVWYYEDVVSKRPVYFFFFAGLHLHLMTFEVGAVLEDAEWQAPTYCFEQNKRVESTRPMVGFGHGMSRKNSMKGVQ